MRLAEVGAVLAVAAIAVLAYSTFAYATDVRTTTATSTLTVYPATGSPYSVELVVIQPVYVNGICVVEATNSTYTTYLVGGGTVGAVSHTTTETVSALSTVTLYYNATIAESGTTCTLVNPHYGASSSSCPPCA
ncbi:MAG: hypothetical protein JRN16_05555 [Nitrososphaerota archaeon]|nr:hypothetical protein [Nitrososphaerota archaeon]MDG7020163.1 hypothetical protein [Nitrososphaerota archaeon]MDG7027855.1 hypothetical protein [Nitrososphaerota archaeon]